MDLIPQYFCKTWWDCTETVLLVYWACNQYFVQITKTRWTPFIQQSTIEALPCEEAWKGVEIAQTIEVSRYQGYSVCICLRPQQRYYCFKTEVWRKNLLRIRFAYLLSLKYMLREKTMVKTCWALLMKDTSIIFRIGVANIKYVSKDINLDYLEKP